MRRGFYVLFVILFVIVGSVYGYRYENTIERTFPITPDGLFKLSTIRGDVSVTTYEGSEIKIDAVFGTSSKEELQNAVLNFSVKSYSVIITGSPKLDGSQLAVNYFVKIPEGLKTVSIMTRLGEIKARGHYGSLELRSAGNDISFSGSFTDSRFNSLNGSLELIVRGMLAGNIKAETSNGSIWLSLVEDSSFTMDAGTQTGTIRSNFGLKKQNRFVGSKLTGSIGDGTHQINLRVANGDITIKKK
jgi:DUF4097 and DUF4098 domain-containing protein YvlB